MEELILIIIQMDVSQQWMILLFTICLYNCQVHQHFMQCILPTAHLEPRLSVRMTPKYPSRRKPTPDFSTYALLFSFVWLTDQRCGVIPMRYVGGRSVLVLTRDPEGREVLEGAVQVDTSVRSEDPVV